MKSKKYISIIILLAFVVHLFMPIAIASNTQVEEAQEAEKETTEEATKETIQEHNKEEKIEQQNKSEEITKEEIQEENETNYSTKTMEQVPMQQISTTGITLKDGIYKIKANVGTNMYLDIDGGSKEPGANLQIWSKSDVDQQKFKVTYLNNGYYKITAVHSGQVLDVNDAEKTNGTNVKQYTDTGSDAQQWTIKKEGDYYTLVSKCNSLNLDIAGGASQEGTNVQMYEGNGSDAQKFKFEAIEDSQEVSPKPGDKEVLPNPDEEQNQKPSEDLAKTLEEGTYKIKANVGTNMYLDIDGGSKEPGANLQIWSKSDVDQQKFKVTYLNNGYYKITAVHSGQVLDVNDAEKTNGTNVKQYTDTGSDAQQWTIKKEGDYYTLVSKCNSLNLDIAGGASQEGTNVQMYEGNGSDAQKYTFEKVDATTPVEPPKEPQEEPKVPTEPEQEPANLADGAYQIKSKLNGGRVIDVQNAGKNDKQNVQIWDNCDVKQQKYHIKNVGDGYYSIRAVHSKKALDVTGGAKENNTNVQQYTYNGTDAQLWKIVKNTDGSYSFISKCNDLYLDVQDAKGNNGDNIQVYQRNDAQDAQKFEITPTTYQEIDNGIYEIQLANVPNKVLDISEGSKEDSASLQIWDRANVGQQKFYVEYNNQEKTYTMEAIHSGKLLDVQNGSKTDGTPVQQ